MSDKKPFYITTTLPYVNAELHAGHATELIRADVIARHKKLLGFEVFFNTGTDEHGMKIRDAAELAGKTPKEYADIYAEKFRENVKRFGLDEEILHLIRTTDIAHEKAAKEFWKRCNDNGYIYKKNYQAKYCINCEEEKTDSELINGHCPIHQGIELEIIDEENYFFKYSAFGERLLEFFNKNPQFIIPETRQNEMRSFIERGLRDFSISRLKTKMPWGIEVPGDPDHIMYVWFDALTSYISTLGWPRSAEASGEGDPDLFNKFWVNGTPTQYCGKDNTRFQGVMWQAMLMAADLPNSNQIVVDGFVTGDSGIKMSKSLGNVINPANIVEEYGTEALRYFVLRELHPFEDSPFTRERFKESYNSGLANGLGNLVSRVMKMAETNLTGPVDIQTGIHSDVYSKAVESFDLKKAMDTIWEYIGNADREIQETEPFKLIKIDHTKGLVSITELVKRVWNIADLLEPFLPETSAKIKLLIKENKSPETPLFARKD